jgi:hypothetical protein
MLNNLKKLLDNKIVITIITMVLTLYASLVAPRLPNSVIQFFDTILGKLIFLFLIAFFSSKNIQISIMIALAYTITLHITNKRSTDEYINFIKDYKSSKEHFTINEEFKVKKIEEKDLGLVKLATCEWYKSLKDSVPKGEFFENYNTEEFQDEDEEFQGDEEEFQDEDEEFQGDEEEFQDEDEEFQGDEEEFQGDEEEFQGDEEEFSDPALEDFTNFEKFNINRQDIKNKSYLYILKNYSSNIYNHKKSTEIDLINKTIAYFNADKIDKETEIEKQLRKVIADKKISEFCKKGGVPKKEFFYNINQIDTFLPANNLSGNSNKMYAPV